MNNPRVVNRESARGHALNLFKDHAASLAGRAPEAAGFDLTRVEKEREDNRLSRLLDPLPQVVDGFFADAVAGLGKTPKEIPSKYFYDQRGRELFDQICQLPEYYLTRKETEILQTHAKEIATAIGSYCEVVQYGTGYGRRSQILLDHLHDPCAWYLIDNSETALESESEYLRRHYPEMKIESICTEFMTPLALPDPPMVRGSWEALGVLRTARRVAFFPGSAIGHFAPEEAVEFLRRVGRLVREDGALLVGVDLKKDVATLERAYDDPAGLTAQLNRNVLLRMNRELGADFVPSEFQHLSFYNPTYGRVEMHLVSLTNQTVLIGGEAVRFEAGETIWTENSYKYTLLGFSALAARAGFHVEHVWTDSDRMFSVQMLVRG